MFERPFKTATGYVGPDGATAASAAECARRPLGLHPGVFRFLGRARREGENDVDRSTWSQPKPPRSSSAGTPTHGGAGSAGPTRPRRSSGSAAGSATTTPSPRRPPTKLWTLITTEDYVPALGCLTGNQAVECAKAGLRRDLPLGLAGRRRREPRRATPTPTSRSTPRTPCPTVVQRINNALRRADQIAWAEGRDDDFLAPIVADAEAGFGGPLNAFELMTAMIEAGAAGVHFEDQLSSEKKCGHLGGKVLVPTAQFLRTLTAARLAADVLDVPTVLVARTDALAATLLTTDVDERDRAFTDRRAHRRRLLPRDATGSRPRSRARSRTRRTPTCSGARPRRPTSTRRETFAEAVHAEFPGKLLAYNCSPSFNWKKALDDAQIATFQKELGAMGYRFQFITLAGFHALNASMFDLAKGYAEPRA